MVDKRKHFVNARNWTKEDGDQARSCKSQVKEGPEKVPCKGGKGRSSVGRVEDDTVLRKGVTKGCKGRSKPSCLKE